MLSTILAVLGYSIIVTFIYATAANICYFLFRGETMFANPHGYSWVEYAIAAGILFGGVFFFDLTRRLLDDAVRSAGYAVVAAFVYLAIAANVVHVFFFDELMFRSVAQYAIAIGVLIVAVAIIEGIRRAAGKQNG